MSFNYRGIYSSLHLSERSIGDLKIIIDFLFSKYYMNTDINCEITTHDRHLPEFFGSYICISTDPSLIYYMQIDYQLAHELTHLIQYNKGLINVERLDYNSQFEIEARENARYIMHEVLKYKSYPIDD